MRKRVVALLLILLLPLGFWVVTAGPPVASTQSCADLPGRLAREVCVRDALRTLVSEDPVHAAEELQRALRARPDLWDVCHTAAHAAGSAVSLPRLAVEKMLSSSATVTACDWGLFHGVLAAYVASSPTLSDASGLLEMCSQASRKADEMLLGCSDSVGHVLFEIGGSFPDAAAICRMLERYLSDAQVSDQALAACVGGVFMQFYEPVAPSARTPVVSEFDPLELCNSLPEDLFLSCAQAVHYAAGSALRDLSRDTSLGDLSPPELLEVYKRRVPTALSEGVATCSTLGEGASLCERELGRYGVQALRGFPQETAHSLICDALSRDSSRAYCLQTARNILG